MSQHEHEADQFAQSVADWLTTTHERGEFKSVRLAAPPAFLGLLRKHLPSGAKDFVAETLSKNLLKESEATIASNFFKSRNSSDKA